MAAVERRGVVRWGSVLAVAALVASGCSGGSTAAAGGRSTTTSVAPPPPSVAPTDPPSVADDVVVPTSTADEPTTTVATTTTTTVPPDPLPPTAQVEAVALRAEPLADFEFPVGMATRPDDPGIYVIGQLGQVWRVVDGVVQPDLVLDLRQRTSVIEGASSERGLLGIAFSPIDQRMFLNFTDTNGDTVLASWTVGANGVADPGSEWLLLNEPQPGPGHNGGGLQFDPGGDLWFGLGDGGGSNGRDARDMSNLLGTVSRITPRTDGPGYDIPADNPFVGQADVRPEIYAFGFRNPWRIFYDTPTGDVWLGDVGNSTIEEIDLIPAGEAGGDYGWYFFEGTRVANGGGPEDAVPPVYEWDRSLGVASVGGVVYRGDLIADLRGSFVFGDLTGQLWKLGAEGPAPFRLDGVTGVVAFHTDQAGELYVVSIWGTVYRVLPA